jgi:hypothetical protein
MNSAPPPAADEARTKAYDAAIAAFHGEGTTFHHSKAAICRAVDAALLSRLPSADRLAQCEASLSIYDAGHDSEYWLRNPSSASEEAAQEVPPVERIEMVQGIWSEPSDPEWRVMVSGYCADFATETAANNFRNAILALPRRITRAPGAVT